MKRKMILGLMLLFATVFALQAPPAVEAQPGVCCVRAAAACAQQCGSCGVADFSCSLDYPNCRGFCTCNPCG